MTEDSSDIDDSVGDGQNGGSSTSPPKHYIYRCLINSLVNQRIPVCARGNAQFLPP